MEAEHASVNKFIVDTFDDITTTTIDNNNTLTTPTMTTTICDASHSRRNRSVVSAAGSQKATSLHGAPLLTTGHCGDL